MYKGSEVFWTHVHEDISVSSIRSSALVLHPEQWRARPTNKRNAYVCGRHVEEDSTGTRQFRLFNFTSVTPGTKDPGDGSTCANGNVRERKRKRHQADGFNDNGATEDEKDDEKSTSNGDRQQSAAQPNENGVLPGTQRGRKRRAAAAANTATQRNQRTANANAPRVCGRTQSRSDQGGGSHSDSAGDSGRSGPLANSRNTRANGHVYANGDGKTDLGKSTPHQRKKPSKNDMNGVLKRSGNRNGDYARLQAAARNVAARKRNGLRAAPSKKLGRKSANDEEMLSSLCDVCFRKVSKRCSKCAVPNCASSVHRTCIEKVISRFCFLFLLFATPPYVSSRYDALQGLDKYFCQRCEADKQAGRTPHGISASEADRMIERCLVEVEAREGEVERPGEVNTRTPGQQQQQQQQYTQLNQQQQQHEAHYSEEESPLCESKLNDEHGVNHTGVEWLEGNVKDGRRGRSEEPGHNPDAINPTVDDDGASKLDGHMRCNNVHQHHSMFQVSDQALWSSRQGLSGNEAVHQVNWMPPLGEIGGIDAEPVSPSSPGVQQQAEAAGAHMQQSGRSRPNVSAAWQVPRSDYVAPTQKKVEKAVDTRSPPAPLVDESVQCDRDGEEGEAQSSGSESERTEGERDKLDEANGNLRPRPRRRKRRRWSWHWEGSSAQEHSPVWAPYEPSEAEGTLATEEKKAALRRDEPLKLEDWKILPHAYDDILAHELQKRQRFREMTRRQVSLLDQKRWM
jgi:hypothetical protein